MGLRRGKECREVGRAEKKEGQRSRWGREVGGGREGIGDGVGRCRGRVEEE